MVRGKGGRKERQLKREKNICVRLGLGSCVGSVVSVQVWLVPEDLGAKGAGGGKGG